MLANDDNLTSITSMIPNEYVVGTTHDDYCRVAAWAGMLESLSSVNDDLTSPSGAMNNTLLTIGTLTNMGTPEAAFNEYMQEIFAKATNDTYTEPLAAVLGAKMCSPQHRVSPHLRSAANLRRTGSSVLAAEDLTAYLDVAYENEIQENYKNRLADASLRDGELPPAVARMMTDLDFLIGSEVR